MGLVSNRHIKVGLLVDLSGNLFRTYDNENVSSSPFYVRYRIAQLLAIHGQMDFCALKIPECLPPVYPCLYCEAPAEPLHNARDAVLKLSVLGPYQNRIGPEVSGGEGHMGCNPFIPLGPVSQSQNGYHPLTGLLSVRYGAPGTPASPTV